ncbi:MAG TPA: TlpA family protein disulfide reductase [Nitrososphaeraceae archaeon]|nr:TlpA family protein disulfide reductase [Nitrososphaeraceae archaeon]
MTVQVGTKAPNLHVAEWVQGLPTNIDKSMGKVILVEVFQVNCPGCFMYGIPKAIEIYKNYSRDDVVVLGLATAFEDYDKNTTDNLRLLLSSGQVIGETLNALRQYGQLHEGNKLSYKIPFPVAMDILRKNTSKFSDTNILDFIETNIPNYNSYSESDKKILFERVKDYLKNKKYSAMTFDEYKLQGTPSAILIDRKGILRNVFFGATNFLDGFINQLVNE